MEISVLIPLIVVWLGLVFFFYRNRIWLFYYLFGSVGLAFIIIFLGRELYLETAMEVLVAEVVHRLDHHADWHRMFRAA